ncbi:hypothetical protein KC367_g8656 [Hortaea werneckii]|nr:hypothetical protein KC367_g8656 [Hortaea werneckii]
MQAAAKAAGIELTSLASKPECAVAASIDHLCGIHTLLPAPLREQSRILSADLGCGTNDYTLVKVSDELAINTKLIVLKETSGPLGGSQRINERLLAVFEDSLGGKDAVEAEAMRLGLALGAFRGHALDSIEVAKKLFLRDPFYVMNVIGTTGLQSSYVFTKAQLQDAFNVVIADVELNIDEYVNDPDLKPDLIFVSGGFGKNRFLHDRLVGRYQGTTVLTPCYYDPMFQEILVAAGALSPRYKQIFTQRIPSRFSYAVIRDEEYDRDVHVDAWTQKKNRRMPIMGVVHPSGWNTDRRFVFGRIFPFLKKDEIVTTTDMDIGVPMSYYVRVHGKLTLKAEFVLIDEEKLEPFMKAGSDTVPAFDGGRHGPAFEKTLTDTRGMPWYEVPAQLCVKYRNERDMVLTWNLLPPHGPRIDVEGTELLLWDAEHSEFFEDPDSDAEEDGEDVIQRALNAKVRKMMVTGSDLIESQNAIRLAEEYPGLCYATVGVHPCSSKTSEAYPDGPEALLQELKKLAQQSRDSGKATAFGEIGLDYDHRLPRRGCVHSFTGTLEEMQGVVALGFDVGINGCSLKKEEDCAVVKEVPLERLQIETDGPWCEMRPSHAGSQYLKDAPPLPKAVKREKWHPGTMVKGRNEPCAITNVAWAVAGIKGIPVEEVAEHAWKNSTRIFGLGETPP